MALVPITPSTFDVDIDIAYATPNNFTGKPIYKKPLCFLHEQAADALSKAMVLARALGYRFKIFDAFRPHEAQVALWNHTPDPEFLSHPETGSMPHCRGVAVDLTLLDSNNHPLDMGTAFDEFSPRSHHGVVTGLNETAQQNRFTLLGIMTAAGWDFYRNEWWHYQLFNCRQYPLLTDAEAGTGLL